MLLWNDLHPYNAVHTAVVPGSLDFDKLTKSLNGVLQTHGLSGLQLNKESSTFQYQGGLCDEKITMVPPEQDAKKALKNEIQRQLNLPIKIEEDSSPFRFFVIDNGDLFYFSIAYIHMAAGAESMVLLMKDIVHAYLGRQGRGLEPPINLYPPTYGRWLRRHPITILRKVLNLPALYLQLNRSWRPCYRDEMDVNIGFSLLSLDATQLGKLKAASKAWGVTINDLFLAFLLKLFAARPDLRVASHKRRQYSVGTIVNIRKHLKVDSRQTFGLFLGSFVVTHQVPENCNLQQLASDVQKQTSVIKSSKRFMASPLDLATSIRSLSVLTMERKKKFYQKHYPLWGGLTNMNLNPIWPQSGEQDTVDYFRAVSTGPTTPLVLSVTTVQDKVNISISYRTTVFTETDIEQFKNEFQGLLQQLQDQPI